MHRILGLFFLLAAPLAAQVVVSEIMFNPDGEERDKESVEIFTLGPHTLDLAGWHLASDGPSSPIHGFGETSLLHPGQYGTIFPSRYFENNSLYNSLILPLPPLFVVDAAQLGENGLANTRGETVELRILPAHPTTNGNCKLFCACSNLGLQSTTRITNSAVCRHIGVPWYPCDELPLEHGGKSSILLRHREITVDSCLGPEINSTCSLERLEPSSAGFVADHWFACPHPAGATRGERNACQASYTDLAIETKEFQPRAADHNRGEILQIDYLNRLLSNQGSEPCLLQFRRMDPAADQIEWLDQCECPALSPGDSFAGRFSRLILVPGEQKGLIELDGMDTYPNNNRSTLAVTVEGQPGDLVINEIQAFTSSSTEEWIELANPHPWPVDLADWSIQDRVRSVELPAFIVQPNGFILLTRRLHEQLPTDQQMVITLPELNNSGDAIELRDQTGNLIDRAEYDAKMGCEIGQSLERIRWQQSGEIAENWCCSLDISGSTPGRYNSASPRDRDLAIRKELSKWICPYPMAGETAEIQVAVENNGLLDIDHFRLILEVVTPKTPKSLYSQAEEIRRHLKPQECAIFSLRWENIIAGEIQSTISLDCAEDEICENDSLHLFAFISYSQTPLVINEVLNNPDARQSEAIELVNRTEQQLLLSQWSISDADTGQHFLFADSLLPLAGQSLLVLSRSPVHFTSPDSLTRFCLLDRFPSLASQDAVCLFDPNGFMMDRVDFDHDLKGRSLERISPLISSAAAENWAASVDLSGHTLGRQNSVYTPIASQKVALAITPKIFSPDGDGYEDVTVIQCQIPQPVARIDVKIYDAAGRLIRSLLSHAESAHCASVLWDGKDWTGKKCRMGIYIVHLRVLDRDQQLLQEEVQTVVVAGEL
ncbi:MAG TPA: lamin tail domain-containing protein [bacterium]|nr:lamin tail domain-containing protein [bacterium]